MSFARKTQILGNYVWGSTSKIGEEQECQTAKLAGKQENTAKVLGRMQRNEDHTARSKEQTIQMAGNQKKDTKLMARGDWHGLKPEEIVMAINNIQKNRQDNGQD